MLCAWERRWNERCSCAWLETKRATSELSPSFKIIQFITIWEKVIWLATIITEITCIYNWELVSLVWFGSARLGLTCWVVSGLFVCLVFICSWPGGWRCLQGSWHGKGALIWETLEPPAKLRAFSFQLIYVIHLLYNWLWLDWTTSQLQSSSFSSRSQTEHQMEQQYWNLQSHLNEWWKTCVV